MSDAARVVFRVRRDEGGVATVEEREVECRPDELAALLAQPWAGIAPRADSGRAARTAALLRQALAQLELIVTERTQGDDRKCWTLAFRPRDEPAPTVLADVVAPEGGETVHAAGRIEVRAYGSDTGEVAARTAGGQSISVANNALLVLQERNEYVNIAIEIHCTIHG